MRHHDPTTALLVVASLISHLCLSHAAGLQEIHGNKSLFSSPSHRRNLNGTRLDQVVDYKVESNNNIFGNIDYFQQLLDTESKEGDVNGVYEVKSESGDEEVLYFIRHIPIFFAMSIPIPSVPGLRVPFVEAPRAVFGASLALHDFNHNISLVVPSVGHETASCPNLKFTTNVYDTQFSPRIGSEMVSEILRLGPRRKRSSSKDKNNKEDPYPTAIIGAALSSVSSSMAVLTGVKSIPMISGSASASTLDNKGIYPTFGRTIPSDKDSAHAVVSFLSEVLNVTHLGVLYRRDALGVDFAKAIIQSASALDPPIVVSLSAYTPEDDDKTISVALNRLQNTGFRYFFGAVLSFEFVHVMTEASKFNITGPGYFWMFTSGVSGLARIVVPPDSPIINATFGSAAVSPAPPSTLNAIDDQVSRYKQFEWHWNNATSFENVTNYLYSLLPEGARDELYPEIRDYFGTITGLESLMYEASMAIAIAACRSYKLHGPNFTGRQLFDEFRTNVSFVGATGIVSMNETTGTRDPQTLTHSILRIIPTKTEDGNVTFQIVPTYAHKQQVQGDEPTEERKWVLLPNATFLFSDNTTTPPDSLPPSNIEIIKIESWAQILGLFLAALILLLSVAFSIWTSLHRNTKIIRAAQPIFLHMLCLGTFILGLAILPLTLQDPLDDAILNVACASTPWLVSGGLIIAFSAILSKLKRISALFNARSYTEMVVEPRDVLRPFAFLFSWNVTVLVAWTIVNPLAYNRNVTGATDPFGRPIEMYGRCINHLNNSAEYWTFASLWTGSIIAVILWANVEAYKARNIATEFSESQYLAMSMVLILQPILIGLPLLFIVDALPTFWYLVKISILFLFCILLLLPIFVPKMWYLAKWREERFQ